MFAFIPNFVPAGVIVFFKGALAAIPAGWHLCDGTNGTDDLRDRIVICAGNTYAVDDSGGYSSHSHGDTLHVDASPDQVECGAAEGWLVSVVTHEHAIGGMIYAANNMTPYVAKGYIQKL